MTHDTTQGAAAATPVSLSLRDAPQARLAAIRLVASDIDGTMTRDGRLVGEVLDAIARLCRAGVEVVPVSGRPSGEVLGLARYLPGVRRAVAENGLTLVVPGVGVTPLGTPPDRPRLLELAVRLGDGAGRAPLRPAEDAFCRLADLAFERDGRSDAELAPMRDEAWRAGVHLIWSNVHIHLSLDAPDKGAAVLGLCHQAGIDPNDVLAIGDAPNDAGFWVPDRFGLAVGCAQVLEQRSVLPHLPRYVVGEAAEGWLEMADALLAARAEAS